jgi:ATP-dependent helicase HrpB
MPHAPSLPIDPLLPDICAALRDGLSLVLQAPPGAGKTTRVPLALLHEPWMAGQRMLMLEPRRLAARAAARRMAQTLGEAVGETVGYRVHLDSKVGPRTRIEVVTEAVLTRRLQADPALEGVALVLFDEVHERNLQADLGLALCLECREGLRDDLRLLAMSATLDGARFASLLGGAPVLSSAGRAFPVETRWRPGEGTIAERVASVVRAALRDDSGSVLVFLPGMAEIRRVAERLQDGLPIDTSLHLLHGSLPQPDQDAAIAPASVGYRKVVLATDIAETSLTIEGVRVVVDAGQRRAALFDPNSGMTRLETRRISQASAEQRRGRAGRIEPGVCYRLWSEGEHRALPAQSPAEILEADLAPFALELAAWGTIDPLTLRWLDPPPPGPFAQARDLLRALGALGADGAVTPHGRAMAGLPVHPRLAHMLLTAAAQGDGALACTLAAVLAERDVLRGGRDADIRTRLDVLRAAGGSGAVRAAREAAADLRRRLGVRHSDWNSAEAGRVLALAYPDRIAQPRGEPGRFLLSGGKGAVLHVSDALAGAPFLVVADLSGGTEARIHLAAPLAESDLPEAVSTEWVQWDARERAVLARRQMRLGALVLKDTPLPKPSPEKLLAAMLDGIRALGLDALPWTPALRQTQARIALLRSALPERDWPDLTDAALLDGVEQWLAPHLAGFTRAEHLARLDLENALLGGLDWAQRQALDDLAPTHLPVPSGDRIRLDYQAGAAPVLAVKLQALFGLTQTPRIADGRVAVVIDLLSPAQRPLARTQDLANFWANVYPEVRKELRGRYPKHPWPENPHEAVATMRTKARMGS